MKKSTKTKIEGTLRCKKTEYLQPVRDYIGQMRFLSQSTVESTFNKLINEGIPFDLNKGVNDSENESDQLSIIIKNLIFYQLLTIHSHINRPLVTLTPSGASFNFKEKINLSASEWKLSRFSYVHSENGEIVLRNPKAHCFLTLNDPDVLRMYYLLNVPISIETLKESVDMGLQFDIVFLMFKWAKIISPCDKDQKIDEDSPTLMQWDFHDLLFHSLSRSGRTEKNMGGTFRFKNILPPQPSIKNNPWLANTIKLPVPNLNALFHNDMPLTAAIESRKSVRNYSITPLTKYQVGEFLYRSARIRYEYTNEFGDFISKPYPGGGACYELEFYITINACSGIPRGLYYYDAKKHMLCLIQEPNDDMEQLLNEASLAAARLGFPQILITLASRFNRFNWKYSSMSYAAQLKNVGVVYQTMYLVATSMNIGASALGTGNTDRFCRMTGLNYFEEGSIGEFMIGKLTL